MEIEDIDRLVSVKEIVLGVGFEPLLHHAQEHGITEPWVEAVERMIRRNRRLRRSALADRLWYYRKRIRQLFGQTGP